jgi:hypothetical protein
MALRMFKKNKIYYDMLPISSVNLPAMKITFFMIMLWLCSTSTLGQTINSPAIEFVNSGLHKITKIEGKTERPS